MPTTKIIWIKIKNDWKKWKRERKYREKFLAENARVSVDAGERRAKSVDFYLSLTNLSAYGLRGRLFIISDSANSYAREIAGT